MPRHSEKPKIRGSTTKKKRSMQAPNASTPIRKIPPRTTDSTSAEARNAQFDDVQGGNLISSSPLLDRDLLETFTSPLAQQGLHPAYLLGLKPIPWQPKAEDLAAHVYEEQENRRRCIDMNGWPGQLLAVNPHMSLPRWQEKPQWSVLPERSVPGYVYEGAEFYRPPPRKNANSSKIHWPKNPLALFASCFHV